MSQFFTSRGQRIGVSASVSVLPMNIQDWFPLGSTGWISLQSKGLSRRSNQSILKEMSPEYSWEGQILKPKLQYCGHLLWRTDSLKRPWCWERLKAGGEEDDRGSDGWMVSLTWCTWVRVSSGSWWWTGRPGVLQSMGSQRVLTWLSDWSEVSQRQKDKDYVIPLTWNIQGQIYRNKK